MSANILHPALQAAQVEKAFDEGRPADAVRDAFREIERIVRALAGLAEIPPPMGLMEAAFAPGNGPLRNPAASTRDQLAVQGSFVEAAARFGRDRQDELIAEDAAVEGLMLADMLIWELDRVAARLGRTVADVR